MSVLKIWNGSEWIQVDSIKGEPAIVSSNTGTLVVGNWSAYSQTITVSGVTASNKLVITPAPSDFLEWGECRVYASAQGTNEVTFTCTTVPTSELTANVLILN